MALIEFQSALFSRGWAPQPSSPRGNTGYYKDASKKLLRGLSPLEYPPCGQDSWAVGPGLLRHKLAGSRRRREQEADFSRDLSLLCLAFLNNLGLGSVQEQHLNVRHRNCSWKSARWEKPFRIIQSNHAPALPRPPLPHGTEASSTHVHLFAIAFIIDPGSCDWKPNFTLSHWEHHLVLDLLTKLWLFEARTGVFPVHGCWSSGCSSSPTYPWPYSGRNQFEVNRNVHVWRPAFAELHQSQFCLLNASQRPRRPFLGGF